MLNLITNHLDVWASAELPAKTGGRGRAASNGKSPHGIQKLRELILELAVRGKLVAQDPNDEPASELLKRIQVEKSKLIAEGKIKKDKQLPPLSDEEKPFELPQRWEWVRLGEIQTFTNGYAFKSQDFQSSGIGVVRIGDVGSNGEILTNSMLYFPSEREAEIPEKFKIIQGDLIISMTGNVKLAFNNSAEDFFLNQRVGKIAPHLVNKFYTYRFLTTVAQEKIDNASGGVIPNVSTEEINETLIPLPPLVEQHRIVAKVDELMALCDQLEQQQTDNGNAYQTLVETLLATLTISPVRPELVEGRASTSSGRTEFAEAWARIAEHFDTLFTTEQSLDQLKQTILQLAVMGKLIPQDPNDEPASELLKKIAAEKSRLIKEKKIKKREPLAEIGDDEMPFSLPQGWERCRFDDLSLHSEAGWSPSCEPIPRQGDNWGVLKVSAVTWGKYNPQENKALPANLEPKPEFEVMPGDFLISRANTAELVARAVVVPNGTQSHLMMSDKIIRFVFAAELNREYLTLVNGSDFSREYYARVAGGTSSSMKNVSREQIRNLVIALPPFKEQHRIVAKVDELVALCEALKTRLNEAQLTQIHLADAIVEQAVA